GFGLTLNILSSAGQVELLQEMADIMIAIGHYPQMATIFSAAAAMAQGDASACLDIMAPLTDETVKGSRVIAPLIGQIRALRATAQEKLGNFRAAYDLHVAINRNERSSIDPNNYYLKIEHREQL